MAGLQMSKVNRVLDGDSVLVVNVDGTVYRVVDAYVPELAMGNLAEQSLEELLQSEAYAASLQRDAEELDQHCGRCEYRAACSHAFVYDTRATFQYAGSCVTAWHCIEFMVKFIQEQGYSEEAIKGLLHAARSSPPPAHPSLGL
jgi:radical SAM protein with 4Fe4S-binding SPASM domain